MTDNVAVVIITIGKSSRLSSLIARMLAETKYVVVVNNSSDHLGLDPAVVVLQGHGNVGYGSAANLGYKFLNCSGATFDWIVIANDDILPNQACIRLISCYKGDASVVSFPLVDNEGKPQRYRASFPGTVASGLELLIGEARATQRRPQDAYPVGALFAIRSDVFAGVGGFDPSFFMYFEETDLFRRVRQQLVDAWWALETSVAVVHDHGTSTASLGAIRAQLMGSSAARFFQSQPLSATAWVFKTMLLVVRLLASGRLPHAMTAGRSLGSFIRATLDRSWQPEKYPPLFGEPRERRREYCSL